MAKIVNKYPVGIQTFEEIREKGYLYIDKTIEFFLPLHFILYMHTPACKGTFRRISHC